MLPPVQQQLLQLALIFTRIVSSRIPTQDQQHFKILRMHRCFYSMHKHYIISLRVLARLNIKILSPQPAMRIRPQGLATNLL